jgi:hypothetical protein
MKKLLTEWWKLLEADNVIQFPDLSGEKEIEVNSMSTKVNDLEDSIGKRLGDLYGNQASIPIEVLEAMEAFLESIKVDQ